MQSLLLAPLAAGDLVTGVLGMVLSLPGQELSAAQTELIRKITIDLSSLEQEARYLDQSRALVASAERNRLARDLHDSVTQVLFSATLLAEVLPKIWRRNPEEGLQRLDKLRQLTRGALAEMRTMLLELRPSAVIKTPLDELLGQLTEAIASRSGLPFQLYIEQIPPLPEEMQTSFYRIAQEALNNVVKHAQAQLVTVNLSAIPLPPDSVGLKRHEIKLVIKDDGVGFSSSQVLTDQLGIGIMHERAASIGAYLSLESRPGYGTSVTVNCCREPEEQL